MCETRMHDLETYQRAPLPQTGDEPCDFCVAIVKHWRDILTANTTEMEFKQVYCNLWYRNDFSHDLTLPNNHYMSVYLILHIKV